MKNLPSPYQCQLLPKATVLTGNGDISPASEQRVKNEPLAPLQIATRKSVITLTIIANLKNQVCYVFPILILI